MRVREEGNASLDRVVKESLSEEMTLNITSSGAAGATLGPWLICTTTSILEMKLKYHGSLPY